MHTHHILTLLGLTLAMNLSMGCSYMDEDIHLSDEEFLQSVNMESMGFGSMGMRGYGSSGCGGGHWGHDGNTSPARHHIPHIDGRLDNFGVGELKELTELRNILNSGELPPITVDDVEEIEEEVHILTNHDLVAQAARDSAH